MPKQENQGNLPQQPNLEDGQSSQTQAGQGNTSDASGSSGAPAANLNPVADPAPITPVTGTGTTNPAAGEPASTPTPLAPGGVGTGTEKSPTQKKKLLKLAAIGVAVIVLIVLGLLFLPFSPLALSKSPPKGPQMMVGQNRFVYACSVFDADIVSKELELNNDKNKAGAEESLSFDPSNTKDKTVDLIKLTGEKSINSNCKLKFDRVGKTGEDGQPTTSYINVSAFFQQFPGESEANEKFDEAKKALGDNAKSLASYGDSSYYVAPTKSRSGPTYVQPVIKHKNLLIYLTAPIKSEDPAGEEMAKQLDKVTKDILTKVDSKQGEKPKNFSGITKLGRNKFVDACASVNYQKFAKELGGEVEYDATSFASSQGFAPSDEDGKTANNVSSLCNFYFRTKADADAVASQKPEISTEQAAGEESVYESHYPHYALVQVATAESKEKAQQLVTDFKKKDDNAKEGEAKFQDVKIGDLAIKVENQHDDTNPYDVQLYYIAKGSRAYLISVSYKRQSQPFKTTDQKISDEQAKKILNVLTAGTSYAQRQ